jgi:antitoxin VapB
VHRVSDHDAEAILVEPAKLHLSPLADCRMEPENVKKARIFWSGRSQAARLPKEFRFRDREVRIRRHGTAVIHEPITEDWAWLDAIAAKLDDDFVQAVNEEPEQQARPALNKLF